MPAIVKIHRYLVIKLIPVLAIQTIGKLSLVSPRIEIPVNTKIHVVSTLILEFQRHLGYHIHINPVDVMRLLEYGFLFSQLKVLFLPLLDNP